MQKLLIKQSEMFYLDAVDRHKGNKPKHSVKNILSNLPLFITLLSHIVSLNLIYPNSIDHTMFIILNSFLYTLFEYFFKLFI